MVRTIGLAAVAATIASSPLGAQEAKPAAPGSTLTAAQPKPLNSAANLRPSDVALRLARVMQPEDLLLDLSERVLREALKRMLSEDADFMALEKKHPGILMAIVDETGKEMASSEKAGMPRLHRRYAQLYESMFLPDEMVEMTTLFASPVGRKLLKAKLAGMNFDPMLSAVAQNPDAPIDRKTMEVVNSKATQSAAAAMTQADGLEIAKMVRPSTMLKMRLAQPTILKFETEMVNEEDPALERAMEQAIERVMKRYGV